MKVQAVYLLLGVIGGSLAIPSAGYCTTYYVLTASSSCREILGGANVVVYGDESMFNQTASAHGVACSAPDLFVDGPIYTNSWTVVGYDANTAAQMGCQSVCISTSSGSASFSTFTYDGAAGVAGAVTFDLPDALCSSAQIPGLYCTIPASQSGNYSGLYLVKLRN